MHTLRLVALLLSGILLCACQQTATPNLPKGADFVLQTASGPLDSKTLRGKVILLFFGYTNCPDICPASLATAAQAYGSLSPAERARVKLIMVSVDPERDSVDHLKTYTAYFHADMVGATGLPDEIAALGKAFGAGYIRQPARADGSYAVDHTTSTYLIDRDGKVADVLKLDTPRESIATAIRKLL